MSVPPRLVLLSILVCSFLASLQVRSDLDAQQTPTDPIDAALLAEWGAQTSVSIDLPTPASATDPLLTDTIALDLPTAGLLGLPTTVSLDLVRVSLRSPDFTLLVHDGVSLQEVIPPPPTTYRGTVEGDPSLRVVAAWTPRGWTGTIRDHSDPRETRVLRFEPESRYVPNAATGAHRLFRSGPVAIACGVADGSAPSVGGSAGTSPVIGGTAAAVGSGVPGGSGGAPLGAGSGGGGVPPLDCDMKRAEIAFDCDYEYYLEQGGDVAATTARIEAILLQVDEFYVRDLRTTHLLTNVTVRTAPFYADISGGDLLTQFRAEWNTNMTAISYDIGHLMTDKQNLSGYAGLAYVWVVCTGSRYGWSVDSAGVVGHEIGHNWGAPHCLDPSPCNNMCGACLNIGPNTRDRMFEHRASRTCLEDIPSPVDPVPPFAARDVARVEEGDLFGGGSITLDLLANDHDTNCDPLVIESVDAMSEKGGTVSILPGAGTNGLDAVSYTPPASGFAGEDSFAAVVGDGVFSSAAEVVIEVGRPEILADWSLDETSGAVAGDRSGNGNDASAVGGLDFSIDAVAGVRGGALSFDGIDDALVAPAPGWDTDTLTISGWVRRDGTQAAWAGILFARGGSTLAGLSVGDGQTLRLHWDGGVFSWNPGLVIPDQTWCFVAGVVEPDRVQLHLRAGEGAPWQSAELLGSYAREAFDADVVLGRDPTDSSARYFRGDLDAFRVHRRALSIAELDALVLGGPADAPRPRRFETGVPLRPVLGWRTGDTAVAHDVYFGTDASAVANADASAPEYRGRVDALAVHPLPELPTTSSFHWAIDTVLPDGTVLPGETWRFTTGSTAITDGLRAYYPFDVGTVVGSSVLDQSGAPLWNSTLQNGTALTPGPFGNALSFDGIDDTSTAAAQVLSTDALTISLWVRIEGPQVPWAGLVFWRGGSTVTGLNFGNSGELRYHWDGGQWTWNSGLVVPFGEWCHIALVVEPGRATMTLNGTSRVRGTTHAVEAFDTALRLGRDPGYSTRDFEGALDDVAIWDRALSPAEIAAIEAAGRIGRPLTSDGDLLPPEPALLTWEVAPMLVGETGVVMRATTATDPSAVEYAFTCTEGPGPDSGWQQSPVYSVEGLPPGATVTYVARARDSSPNLNETLATPAASVTTLGELFLRGDTNGDGSIDIADAIRILAHLFQGDPAPCLLACDTNDSEVVDIADAITHLAHLFQGAGALPAPFPACGVDPTAGPLPCDDGSGCP